MKFLLLFLSITIFQTSLHAKERPIDIKIRGFVAVDAVYDSRESKTARNNHIYLYPLPSEIKNGVDINNQGSFDIDAAHSRISLHVEAAKIENISVYGMIEADFLGSTPTSDTNLRLRQAYIQLGFHNFNFVAGQTWHPFFIPEHYPRTLNANVGAPIHPLNRSPQLRLTHTANTWLKWSLIVLEQNNFRSAGFQKGSEKAGFPEIDLQIQLGGSGNVRAALTGGYKRLAIPHADDVLWTTQPIVKGVHFQSNFLITLRKCIIRTGAVYGDNLTEHVMPGGVGFLQSSNPVISPKYKPLSVVTAWIDINSKSKKWDPGLFLGHLDNLGASQKVLVDERFSRDSQLDNLWAISPRLRYHVTPQACFGLEFLYTQAGWGGTETVDHITKGKYDSYGKPQNIENFYNHRTLLSVRYNF